MRPFLTLLLLATTLAGCASVTTRVLETNPAVRYPPSPNVEVLFEPPQRPYTVIATLEAEGDFGVGEIALLEDMRQRAQALGADALVRTDGREWYQPPSAVYDPLYDPFFFPRRYYSPYQPFGPVYGGYRWIPGGYYHTARAMAIRYQGEAPPPGKLQGEAAPPGKPQGEAAPPDRPSRETPR